MSSTYDEGPYKNWTAISFPLSQWVCDVSTIDISANVYFRKTGVPAGGVELDELKAIYTGVDSGASVDLRNLTQYGSLVTNSGPPDCEWLTETSKHVTYPAGASIPNSVNAFNGAVFPVSFLGHVALSGRPTYEPVAGVCTIPEPFDTPTLPAFIDGEMIKLTY